MQYRNTYIRVDISAVGRNTAALKHAVSPAKMLAVVKANAYGHGSVQTAQTVLKNGAEYLGVAIPEEGETLRLAGITAPILVLGSVNAAGAEASVRLGLTQTVFDPERVEMLERAAARQGKEALVHLKCDTGMGRIGVRDEKELRAVLDKIAACPHVRLTGAFTHFADADGAGEEYTRLQIARFEKMRKLLPAGILIHASASAAAARYPEARYDMVREGISLYGCPPVEQEIKLEPALSWHTEIACVKAIAPGECVSYGCTFRARKETRVATLPVGYGDGYHRALSERAQVLIAGKRCPVIGRVCMDQTMVDVTGLAPNETAVGAPVVLLGKQDEDEITAGQLASWAGTISYEMLLAATARVPIIYVE